MTNARTIAVDGSKLREILDMLGAPPEPTEAGIRTVADLEELLGKPLPKETREYLLTPVHLTHPDAEHPEIDPDDFLAGLPDVEAFIDELNDSELSMKGYFTACCHFLGMFPIGVQLQYGDFMYAMALLEPHTGDRLGGVMYYDEREVGGWAPTISDFLVRATQEFWEQCDAQVDGADQDEVELDYEYLSDCFVLPDYDWTTKPPEPEPLPEAVEEAYDAHWRQRLEQRSRWWIPAFMTGRFARWQLDQLPTPQQWEEERDRVAETHHDAMYWLFAHMLLDNRDELADCIEVARANPSRIVAAVVDYFAENGELAERWNQQREIVFQMVRAFHAAG